MGMIFFFAGTFIICGALALKIHLDNNNPSTTMQLPFTENPKGEASEATDRMNRKTIVFLLVMASISWWFLVAAVVYVVQGGGGTTHDVTTPQSSSEIGSSKELTQEEMAFYRAELLVNNPVDTAKAVEAAQEIIPVVGMEEIYVEKTQVGPAHSIKIYTYNNPRYRSEIYYTWFAPDGTKVLWVHCRSGIVQSVSRGGEAYWMEDGTPCWSNPRDLEAERLQELKELEEQQAKAEAERKAAEAEAAKQEQARLAELKTKLPYVGLSELDIGNTWAGEPVEKQEDVYFKKTTYFWRAPDGRLVLTAVCRSGAVTEVERWFEDEYWNADGTPRWDNPVTAPASSQDSYTKKEVVKYATPDAYAEAHFDDYYDIAVGLEPQGSEHLWIDLAYEMAYDDWYKYHP